MAVAVAPWVPDQESEPRQLAYRGAIKAFADVAIALREGAGRDELLRLTADKMCELVGVSRCSLYLRDEETGLYRGQVSRQPRNDASIKRLVGGVEADGFTREIVKTRKPVAIHDALHDPRVVRSTMRTWHVRSMLGVPMVVSDVVTGIFFLDSQEQSRRFSELDQDLAAAFAELAAAAVCHAELILELCSSHDTVARQNRALRQAAAVDDRFTKLVIGGGSLSEIADAVAELTKKQCAIYDPQMCCLSAAGGEEGSGLDLRAADARKVARVIAEVSSDRPSVVGPFPELGIYRRLLVAPVTVRDAQWAKLVLAEHDSPFNVFDTLIARRVANIIALEMSAERRAILAERNARASLAAELIRGNCDVADVERRANFLGIQLDAPHVVCLVTWRDGNEGRLPDAETVASAVSRVAPDLSTLATGVLEGIVLILALPAGKPVLVGIQQVKEDIATACAPLDPDGRMVAGLSMGCFSATDYVRAYEQACQVVTCLNDHCHPGSIQVLSADDLGPGRLLLAGSDSVRSGRFIDETIGALLDEDVPSELLETLACFFENGRSVRRSGSSLDVHENTIRYRLSKIEELTGMDIASDCDAQLSTQIALLMLRLQGVLPPPGSTYRAAAKQPVKPAAAAG